MCGCSKNKNGFAKRWGGSRTRPTVLEWLKAASIGFAGRGCVWQSAVWMRCVAIAFIIICLLNAGAADVEKRDSLKVFVLNSYHRGYDWSDRIMETINTEFSNSELDLELYIEYMDTQRYGEKPSWSFVKPLLEAKYQDVRFDVIVSLDDAAFDFVLYHRDHLFRGIPIVFCGVQNESRIKQVAQDKLITGVVERYDWESTVKIAIKLHPSTTQIAFIGEMRLRDFNIRTGLSDIVHKLDERIELKDLSLYDLSMAELLEEVQQLTDGSIVLYDSSSKDREGTRYTLEYSLRTIRKHCAVPIYITGFRKLGLGPVGGMLTDGTYQGKVAAEMAIRILEGESPDSIPIVAESPNTYMFDYTQLKHFGIRVSDLPKGSDIINQPQSYYYQHKKKVWAVAGLICGLTAVIVVLSLNILKRRRAEEKLHKAEVKYRTLVEQIPAVTYIAALDKTSTTLYVSPQIKTVIGFSPEEYKADPDIWQKQLHPDDRQRVLDEVRRTHKTGEPLSCEYRMITRDGRVVWLRDEALIVTDDNGEPLFLQGVMVDVTERRKGEDELKESEERFRAIFDNATDGILLADPETKKFTACNNTICQMLGYDLDEVKKLGLEDIHPQEHLAYVMGQFEKQARREITLAKDIPVKRKDGSVFYADVNSAPVKLGGKTYLMGLFRDITDRRRAEEQLQEARDELEVRVRQRTAELAKLAKELRSLASELSLAEERARRRMAVDIHDHVGQKLAISKMKLESLAESASSSEVAAALRETNGLIAQVIESTRSLTFELSPPVLYELGFVAAVEWLTKQARQQHGLETEFTDDGCAKPLDDDIRVLLFQAVRELLVNVAKHANARSVQVSTKRVGDTVRVSVEDDGVGFNLSGAPSRRYGSAGFGLFSIHERLGHIGGHLKVESEPGHGTRVSLVAPINHRGKKGKRRTR